MLNTRQNAGEAEVTVVIPTHDRKAMLQQALQSISRQRDVSLSVIVVDDASIDGTSKLVEGSEGVHLIRHEIPMEQALARNHGVLEASTPWIAFCDDDDLWEPTKLRRQLDAAKAGGSDWCTVNAVYVDHDLVPVGGSRLADPHLVTRQILERNIIPVGVPAFSFDVHYSKRLAVFSVQRDLLRIGIYGFAFQCTESQHVWTSSWWQRGSGLARSATQLLKTNMKRYANCCSRTPDNTPYT